MLISRKTNVVDGENRKKCYIFWDEQIRYQNTTQSWHWTITEYSTTKIQWENRFIFVQKQVYCLLVGVVGVVDVVAVDVDEHIAQHTIGAYKELDKYHLDHKERKPICILI